MAGQAFTKLQNSGKLPTSWSQIDKILDDCNVTPKYIFQSIKNIADNGSERGKLKALDMLAKYANLRPPVRVDVTGLEGVVLKFSEEGDDGE